MEVVRSENPIETTAKLVSDALRAYADTPLLLLVAGGSWHAVLERVDTTNLGPWCTLLCLDERFSDDPASNNFRALHKLNFFKEAVAHTVQVISTEICDGDTIERMQNRFEQALQNWRQNHHNGNVLALIGIGGDGHIAGIFPELLYAQTTNSDWTQSYTVTQSDIAYPKRITVSEYFLTQIVDQAIVYASGEDKKEIITKLLGEGSMLPAPARILCEMQNVILCTDNA